LGQARAKKGDLKKDDLEAAMKSFMAAQAIREELADENPEDDVARSNVAHSYREIGSVHAQNGNPKAAIHEYNMAIDIWEKLLNKDPTNALWLNYLAPMYSRIAPMLESSGDEIALDRYQRVQKVRSDLQIRAQGDSDRQKNLAFADISLADYLLRRNMDLHEAEKLYTKAIALLDEFRPKFDGRVFNSYISLGDISVREGSIDAVKHYEQAKSIAEGAGLEGSKEKLVKHYEDGIQSIAELKTTDLKWAELAQGLQAKLDALTRAH
jgi:tetratricopeptide (TPR) repeat protein